MREQRLVRIQPTELETMVKRRLKKSPRGQVSGLGSSTDDKDDGLGTVGVCLKRAKVKRQMKVEINPRCKRAEDGSF